MFKIKITRTQSSSTVSKTILISAISAVVIAAATWVSVSGYALFQDTTKACSQGALYRFKINGLMGTAISSNSYSALLTSRPLSYVDGESSLSFISARGSLNSDINLVSKKAASNFVTGLLLTDLSGKLNNLSNSYSKLTDVLTKVEINPNTRTYLSYDDVVVQKIGAGLSLMNYALNFGKVIENPYQKEIDSAAKKRDAAYSKVFTPEVQTSIRAGVNEIIRKSKPVEAICKAN